MIRCWTRTEPHSYWLTVAVWFLIGRAITYKLFTRSNLNLICIVELYVLGVIRSTSQHRFCGKNIKVRHLCVHKGKHITYFIWQFYDRHKLGIFFVYTRNINGISFTGLSCHYPPYSYYIGDHIYYSVQARWKTEAGFWIQVCWWSRPRPPSFTQGRPCIWDQLLAVELWQAPA